MFVRPSYLSTEQKAEILSRLWQKDPSLWSAEPEDRERIRNRLGWLDVLPKMKEAKPQILALADDVRKEGFQRVVLLGMGGSSLCPLIQSRIFGSSKGFPTLEVLDTTDPEEIERAAKRAPLRETLFVVASKSGTTIEPNLQFTYFWSFLEKEADQPGNHFVAITDEDTPLDRLGIQRGFRKVFRNPSDIGGRYSALSFFGLVPAALMGIDIGLLIERAEAMIKRCGPDVPWDENPGCRLGEFLGEFAVQSRDKLSILADPPIYDFGLWLEQLIAESTGKDTHGLVPIVGETTGIPGFYGGERIFVYLRMKGIKEDEGLGDFIRELREADFPVYEILLDDIHDLGGQYFLWEMATALVSHFLGVNGFDEPDVSLAKEKTTEVLQMFRSEGKLSLKFWVDPQSEIQFRPSKLVASGMKGLPRALRDIFQVLPSWGYLAFLPYLPYDQGVEEIIGEMRYLFRQERGCATVMGFGPRYLHSTGQIQKGGPSSCAFLIFTRKRSEKYPKIPGEDITFWHVQFAQAVGDFEALSEANRRVIHIQLPEDYLLGLKSFSKVFSRAVRL